MGMLRNEKLKKLHNIWPSNGVATSVWLRKQGFTLSDIQKYLTSQWIESIGHGAYKIKGSTINWEGAIFGLQQQLPEIHVGGRTALELAGTAHYVNLSTPKIFLYSNTYIKLPAWVQKEWGEWKEIPILITSKFLDTKAGLDLCHLDHANFLNMSSRERAMLEMLHGLNTYHSFEECNFVMENLTTLRPDVVQDLLEHCKSIKVKRAFLFLAHKNQHKWFNNLDLKLINLGKGARKLVENGVYDSQFKITYPGVLKEDDKVSF